MICNICSEEIEENQEVKLVCDPSKHIFCIECITEWYKQIKRLKNVGNYYTLRMCPICRGYGGYLPFREGQIYIKGIHKSLNQNHTKNEDKICNQKLKHMITSICIYDETDSVTNLKVLAQILRTYGCEVTEADNGRKAIDKFFSNKNSYDIIFMDNNMPIMVCIYIFVYICFISNFLFIILIVM